VACFAYFAIRSFSNDAPIWVKAAPIPSAVDVGKNEPSSAQYLRTADSGSPSVLTWIV
jgi:hypothetical protein